MAWSPGGDHPRGKWARHLPPTLSQGHLGLVVRPRRAGPYPPSRPAGRLPRPWHPAQKKARRAALPQMPGTQTLCLDLWAGFPGGPTAVTAGQRPEDPFRLEGHRAVFHPGASLRRHLPESRGTRTGVQGSRSSTLPVTASCPGSLQPGSPPGTQSLNWRLWQPPGQGWGSRPSLGGGQRVSVSEGREGGGEARSSQRASRDAHACRRGRRDHGQRRRGRLPTEGQVRPSGANLGRWRAGEVEPPGLAASQPRPGPSTRQLALGPCPCRGFLRVFLSSLGFYVRVLGD